MQNAAEMARDRQFNMRVSDEEMQRLDAVAAHYGLNPANLLRMLVKQKADELGIKVGEETKPAKKPAKK